MDLLNKRIKNQRTLLVGNIFLISFLVMLVSSLIYYIGEFVRRPIIEVIKSDIVKIAVLGLIMLIIFWVGIIILYLKSGQLEIKYRFWGLVCGMIPVANIIALLIILKVSISELIFEGKKIRLDKKRYDEKICQTKYPILMVHGVFFRDFTHFNYWGRIPEELEINGARIFYGEHESASNVEGSANELASRIRSIVEETACTKVNVIAHSKGGLDIKYAIKNCGIGDMVASVTTINTPHRGCEFADYLMNKAGEDLKRRVAKAYNGAFKLVGDKHPDFIAAVTDLTASTCKKISEDTDDFDYKSAAIFTQSVGSRLKKARGGKFPLNMSYLFVKNFDGPNDGLVGKESFPWGEKFTFLENKYSKGISHGDMIDLNRINIKGFDVREFYVNLVRDLKSRGL